MGRLEMLMKNKTGNQIYKMVHDVVDELSRFHLNKVTNDELTIFTKNNWELKIYHSTTLIGYDFVLEYQGMYLGANEDTDLYPLLDNEYVDETYNVVCSIKEFVNYLLGENIYYNVHKKITYFACPASQGKDKYNVKIVKKNFIFRSVVLEVWPKEKVVKNLIKISI